MMTDKDYIEQRVNEQIKWHSSNSRKNKVRYKGMRTVVIGLSVLVPLCAVLITEERQEFKYITAFIGAMIAFLEGLLALNKHQEKWTDFRATAEILKREKFLYATKSGRYKEMEVGEAFSFLVESVEGILAKESAEWMEYISEEAGDSEV